MDTVKILTAVEGLAAAGAYSFVSIDGDKIETAGQIGQTSDGNLVEGLEAQTHQTMQNLGKILAAAGSGLDRVTKTRIYMLDAGDKDKFRLVNGIYASYFSQGTYPPRVTVGVAALPLGALVEMEMTASLKPLEFLGID